MKRNFCFCMFMSLILFGFSSTAVSQFGDPVPRYPQEMDGMVNMMDRSVYFSATDLAVPGRGLGINFTRTYNSDGVTRRWTDPSHIGHAWSHSYQWELRKTVGDHTTNYRKTWSVMTGSGSIQNFTQKTVNSKTVYRPESGVRATLTSEDADVFIYTTKAGIRYKFEKMSGARSDARHVLTEIKDPNGNKLTLHYENAPESNLQTQAATYPRLVAVEDSLGRILKFYYDYAVGATAYPRYITKIEFGLGSKTALTSVYQTVKFTYARYRSSWSDARYTCLTSAAHQLGSGDPRGTDLEVQYEYLGNDTYGRTPAFGYLSRIVSPLGNRTGFGFYGGKVRSVTVQNVPTGDSTYGEMIYHREYADSYIYGWQTEAYNKAVKLPGITKSYISNKRHHNEYYVGSRQYVTRLNRKYYRTGWGTIESDSISSWSYSNRNVIRARLTGGRSRNNKPMYDYRISYAGTNAEHNSRLGNATKWEQVDPVATSTVLRKWEADYETKYNRPIWQIDPMGHKTTFTYDTKGNLTEQRSKANTGTQPHAVSHDIITKHTYDSYGNRIKTTFMPDTTQEKVVETVYDSTHSTYPIEVKTTVTVDGTAHTIKTKSEWDVNRGLKTADIDAQGRRTEYAYWKDRKLKYSRRVADDLYTVPTYDKNGNVTQTQVRKNNWQTGTLIAQTKTEYDGMNRAVKAHSFNDNWTTPYASTETIYDGFGDVSETKDPRNLKTTYTRDRMSRVTKQTLPDGDWVETRYNALNQVTKAWTSQTGTETSPAVSNTYDNLNRLSQVSYSTSESVSYTYDLGDNVLAQQTSDGTNTYTYTYTHDQLNRVMTQNNSLLGYKTFYEYDDASMRKRMYIQPSAGGTTLYDVNYTYDEANRLLSVKDALAAKTASYGYFDIGALKKITVPNGITAHRTLDNINRLSTLTYKKDASTTLSSLTYTYDDKSNVTQLVRDDTGAGGSSKTFTFGYDNISRLTSANYGNETVSYTYDKSGNRLTQVSSVDGTTTYTVATNSNQLTRRSLVPEDTDFSTMNYTYDAEGKLTQRSEGTDSDAFTYGFGSQLKQIQKTRNNTVTQTLTYAYDGGGKRVKVTDSRGTRYFLYDGLMPVLELDSSKNITASYFYGGNGVVYRRKHNAVAHWHFDEGTGTVAHDVDGSQNGTLGGGTENKKPAWSTENGGSLLFDGTNDVLKVADSDALDLVGNTLTLSCWVKRSTAASGNVVKKADASNGYRLWLTSTGAVQFDVLLSGTTKTVTSATTIPLNTWKHVAARYDGSELRVFIGGTKETASTTSTASLAATTEVLWLGYYDGTSHHLNGYLDDVSIYDTALSDAEITNLSNNQMGRYEYHHTNALGSNIVLTDDTKNVLVRYEYDVFGAVRSEVGASDNTRKFTGKEYETDVKLYYFAARYYDPHIGRFTQRDPIGDGINWYAYVDNNPLAFIDPTGLRRLSATEKEKAKKFFGDIIDWDKVDIRDKHFFSSALSKKKMAMTVNNTIFGKNMSDDLLIHELVHVWQFQQERIEPVSAGAVHVIFTVTGQRKELYQYKLDPLGDPDRKRFQDYSFEEQAAILQDAYLVLFTEFGKPINNKIFNLGSQPVTDTMKEHYQFLVDEFKQWHDELNSSDTQP
ncbi:MAG: DUF6531 domain-containing protein [Candidatus Poribacteria bacterium]|nr:DUF6531 domain-containing protein [Candidatus Poribacteria bacterium]